MKIIAVVVAGGNSSRLGGNTPKQYINVNGKLLVEYSLEKFLEHKKIDYVLLVVNSMHEAYYKPVIDKFSNSDRSNDESKNKFLEIAYGGDSRQKSVFSGLKAIESHKPDCVLIHDSARPLVTEKNIDDVIEKLEAKFDAVAPVIELVDTIGMKNDSTLTSILNRESLCAIQTPQGFNFNKIVDCHYKIDPNINNNSNDASDVGNIEYTDDISIAINFNIKPKIVPGDRLNFKITDSFDFGLLLHYLNNRSTS